MKRCTFLTAIGYLLGFALLLAAEQAFSQSFFNNSEDSTFGSFGYRRDNNSVGIMIDATNIKPGQQINIYGGKITSRNPTGLQGSIIGYDSSVSSFDVGRALNQGLSSQGLIPPTYYIDTNPSRR